MNLVIFITNWDHFLFLMNIDMLYLIRQQNFTRNGKEFTYNMSNDIFL